MTATLVRLDKATTDMEKGGGGGGVIQQRNTGFVAYKIVARCQVNILDRFNKQSRKKNHHTLDHKTLRR